MNKGELIDKVASEVGESKAAVARTVEALIKCIESGVREDASVTISNFGTFNKKARAARTGRNPSTGEPIRIQASTTVTFKPSQSLKDAMEVG
ncbi:MAG: HU family DNA-binding protein [Phycisphaerales bacterium]